MDEVKKAGKDSLAPLLMLGLVALLLLLIFACGIVAILYFYPAQPEGGPENASNGSAQDGQNATGGGGNGGIQLNTSTSQISAEDMALWESINVANVQQACLMKAKEEAGESADLVYSCTCEESAGALFKGYECSIRTADPFTAYFANIDCSLTSRICTVETNYGTTNVTFVELRDMYGE